MKALLCAVLGWFVCDAHAQSPLVIGRDAAGKTVSVSQQGSGEPVRFFGGVTRPKSESGVQLWIEKVPAGPYPPTGDAYAGENAAAHTLWRFLLMNDLAEVVDESGTGLGAAWREHRYDLAARLDRSPEEMIEAVAPHYARSFSSNAYLEGVALMATFDPERARAILEPWLSGAKSLKPANNAGVLAGRLVFTELDDPRALKIVVEAADLGFNESGKPRGAMPTHNEMSDAVFMACPLLARAGRLTGQNNYFDLCARHLRFMQEKCLRDDGLYRHSPLNDGAWSRGNGFPALGLALSIPEFPEDHPERAYLIDSLKAHLSALKLHRHPSGMWHQLIDRPDSYREFTSTCMITYALSVANREGWLKTEPEFIDRSWNAIKKRVSLDGKTFFDACTGTGKQKQEEDYYLRKAILGNDQRSAAMLLLLAREMMGN